MTGYPNRNCSHGSRRLHRTASLRHESSESLSEASEADLRLNSAELPTPRGGAVWAQVMRDAMAFVGGPTPEIDDQLDEGSTLQSTPCPDMRSISSRYSVVQLQGASNDGSGGLDSNEGSGGFEFDALHASPFERYDDCENTQVYHPEIDRVRVHETLDSLQEGLAALTAMVDNMWTCNQIFQDGLGPLEPAPSSRQERQGIQQQTTLALLFSLIIAVAFYVGMCWINSPETAYVMARRRQVLGL